MKYFCSIASLIQSSYLPILIMNTLGAFFVCFLLETGFWYAYPNADTNVYRHTHMVNSSVTDMTFRQFFVLPGILQKKWLASNTFHWVYQAHLSISDIHMKFHQILLNGSRENELTVSVTDMTRNGRSFFTYL